MAIGTTQVEWLNKNAGRTYPFEEGAGLAPIGTNGEPLYACSLPKSIIVDLSLTIPDPGVVRLYMGTLTYAGDLLSCAFFREDTREKVSTVTVDIPLHYGRGLYNAYPLTGLGSLRDARGVIVIGDLKALSDRLPEGTYTYTPDQTRLEATVARPNLQGVRSIALRSGVRDSQLIQGAIRLIAGANIRLTYDNSNNGIRIDAQPNYDYVEYTDVCSCPLPFPGVRTINGIPTDNVILEGDGCITVTHETGNRIKIADTCSEPCCGCDELAYLAEITKTLEVSITNLEEFSKLLQTKVDTFITNYMIANMEAPNRTVRV